MVTFTTLHLLAMWFYKVNMIPDIAALFTRAVSKDKIQPNAIIGEQEDLTTLNASNWYFTSRKDSQTAKELPFHPDVDPYGNLARLLGTALVHIEENKVSYYERVISDHAGDARYIAVKPACVSVGDIVELQVSFIMVPLRDNNFKVTMVLCSILVLDRSYTQKATAKCFAQPRGPHPSKADEVLKRRVGYFEEQLSTTRAKLSNMQVDEADEAEVGTSFGIGGV